MYCVYWRLIQCSKQYNTALWTYRIIVNFSPWPCPLSPLSPLSGSNQSHQTLSELLASSTNVFLFILSTEQTFPGRREPCSVCGMRGRRWIFEDFDTRINSATSYGRVNQRRRLLSGVHRRHSSKWERAGCKNKADETARWISEFQCWRANKKVGGIVASVERKIRQFYCYSPIAILLTVTISVGGPSLPVKSGLVRQLS